MHASQTTLDESPVAPPTQLSAGALVEAARHDPAAFTQLYRQHYERIGSYLLRRIGDRHEAEDAVGEVFLAAYSGLARFQDCGKPIVCWLYGIATRVIQRRRRSRHLRLETFEDVRSKPSDGDTPCETAAERECVERARAALESLPKRFRDVLALHYLEGLGVDDIAAALEIAPGTVKSRLSRGRDRIRTRIEDSRDEH